MTSAERALEWIEEASVVGLGTGRAAAAFVHTLGVSVRRGRRLQGVPTSQATANLAAELGIPLLTLEEAGQLDVTVDGADEVDLQLDLIKGYGGAMVREKIVAASSKRLLILVGPEKLVDRLGARGKLPVEVAPFGLPLCRSRLAELGCRPELKTARGDPYVTDNGNYILDCKVSPIASPAELERDILSIPGVVGTGLFLGMAHTVLIQTEGGVEERTRG